MLVRLLLLHESVNSRERRTIRIGVMIGTVVGLIGCSEPSSNFGAGRQDRGLSPLSGISSPNRDVASGRTAASPSESFVVQAGQTPSP